MNKWLRSLLLAVGVLSLAACGGGSSGTPTGDNGGGGETSTTVTLNGLVYDEELADASVEVKLNGVVIGTATTNHAGEYSIALTVANDDLSAPIVIEASRGSFFLASLPGSMQKIANAAQDGITSSDTLPGLNVTNVSTAQYVLIVQNNNGEVPANQADIDGAIQAITDLGLGNLILEIAAAIKVIIDAGVELPSGLSNTLALAEALSQEVRDTEVEQFMTDNSIAISEAETAIQEDPILATQISTEGPQASDLAGKTFIVRERADLLLSFDPIEEGQTGGAVDVYAFATVSDFLRELSGSPLEGGQAGSWSLVDGTFTLSFTDRDNELQDMSFTVTGGTSSVVNISHAEFGAFTLHEIDRSFDTSHLPYVGFGMAEGRNMELPASCDGTQVVGNTAFNRRATSHVKSYCSYNEETGAFVLWPYQLVRLIDGSPVISDISHFEPRFFFPLKGSNNDVALFSNWIRQIDIHEGQPVEQEDPTTSHIRHRLPVNRGLPTAGATTLRIDSSARMSINEIGMDSTSSTVYQLNGYFLEDGELEQDVTETPRTIAADGYAGIDIVTSTSDIDDSMVHVFALSGGTLQGGERVVRNAATLAGGPSSNNFSRTRIEYLMGELVEADLSDKTFILTHFRAEDVAATGGQEIIATFNIDGTGSFTSGDEGGEFDWEINSRGALVITMPWEDDGEEGIDLLTFYKSKLDIGTGKAMMAMYGKEFGEELLEVRAFIFTEQLP